MPVPGYWPPGYCPGGYCPGGYWPGGYVVGGYCPGYVCASAKHAAKQAEITTTRARERRRIGCTLYALYAARIGCVTILNCPYAQWTPYCTGRRRGICRLAPLRLFSSSRRFCRRGR